MKRTELADELKAAAREIASSPVVIGLTEIEASVLGAMVEHGCYTTAAADLAARRGGITEVEGFQKQSGDYVRRVYYKLAKRAGVAVPYIPKPRKPKAVAEPVRRRSLLKLMADTLAGLLGRKS